MSKIIIVNRNDVELGSKDREAVDRDRDIYRCASLWITNSKGQILLAQRAFSKSHHPGKWGPAVAGTVEEGETYESNIVKETHEEIGLTEVEFVKGPKTFTDGKYIHFTQWFKIIVDKPIEDFTIDPREVKAIKWWDKDELKESFRQNPDQFLPKMLEYFKVLEK